MSKKFISGSNLQSAWQNHIKPEIDKKQDELPAGTPGQVLTKTTNGVEWKDQAVSKPNLDIDVKWNETSDGITNVRPAQEGWEALDKLREEGALERYNVRIRKYETGEVYVPVTIIPNTKYYVIEIRITDTEAATEDLVRMALDLESRVVDEYFARRFYYLGDNISADATGFASGGDVYKALQKKLDSPSTSGTTGQVLTKTKDGVEWSTVESGSSKERPLLLIEINIDNQGIVTNGPNTSWVEEDEIWGYYPSDYNIVLKDQNNKYYYPTKCDHSGDQEHWIIEFEDINTEDSTAIHYSLHLQSRVGIDESFSRQYNFGNPSYIIPDNESFVTGQAVYGALLKKLDSPETAGKAGQVLTKTANGLEWKDPEGSATDTRIDQVINDLDQLKKDLASVKSTAESAQSTATAAQQTASEAKAAADTAQQTAEEALLKAGQTSGMSEDNLHKVTHAELLDMVEGKTLTPGHWYRITDYVTTVANDPEARSARHPFDVVVLAASESQLFEEARACKHSDDDSYFENANLAAWRIWYSVYDNDKRFHWADFENGKGVIYRMIDEFGNDCPYDFKNIQFKRYAVEPQPGALSGDLNGKFIGPRDFNMPDNLVSLDNFIWVYTFSLLSSLDDSRAQLMDASLNFPVNLAYGHRGYCGNNTILPKTATFVEDDMERAKFCLNNIVIIGKLDEDFTDDRVMDGNKIDSECHNCTLFGGGNHIGYNCWNIIEYVYSGENTIGDSCHDIVFDKNCADNTINSFVSEIVFGHGCYYNSIGAQSRHIALYKDSSQISIGKSCNAITILNIEDPRLDIMHNHNIHVGNDVTNLTLNTEGGGITVYDGVKGKNDGSTIYNSTGDYWLVAQDHLGNIKTCTIADLITSTLD